MVEQKPPKIRHYKRPTTGHTQMAYAAASNVRLSKRATALLMLYENCLDGFRPSLQFVENQTGICKNKVSEIRSEIAAHGLIGYEAGTILIDWERIRIYAALPEKLPKRGVHKTYIPTTFFKEKSQSFPKRKHTHNATPRKLAPWEESFFSQLELLSDNELEEMISSFPEAIKEKEQAWQEKNKESEVRLFMGTTIITKINRSIDYIKLWHHKLKDGLWYATNTNELYSILVSSKLHITRNDNNRLRVITSHGTNYNSGIQPYLYQIAYACYYCGLTARTLVGGMRKLLSEWKMQDITIDHLDGDKNNNCKENLSLMTRQENQQKFTKTSKFRDCFGLIPAYNGSGYLLEFSYLTGRRGIYAKRYLCHDAKSLNQCIDYLWENRYEIREVFDGVPFPNSGYNLIHNGVMWVKWDTIVKGNKYQMATGLANRPLSDFSVWEYQEEHSIDSISKNDI